MSFHEKAYIDASAGTGKTYWIVETKLKDLYETLKQQNKVIDPFSRILIVTYTEKATGELRNRIRKMCNKNSYTSVSVDNMHIFTIHSFCQHVLQDYSIYAGQPSELTLIDANEDASSFVDKWMRDSFPSNKDLFNTLKKNSKNSFDKNVRIIKDALSKALQVYDESMEIEQVIASDLDNIQKNTICPFVISSIFRDCNIYVEWKENKRIRKVQTYNDMIIGVKTALEKQDSQLLYELKNRYDGIFIDEFQDTNALQWSIFSKIFNDEKHFLYVVGDPKQSIFSFQGSDLHVYNEAIKTIGNNIELRDNWRSSEKMIERCSELFHRHFPEGIQFSQSLFPNKNKCRPLMNLCGDVNIEPFWFPEKSIDEYEFASFAAERIKFCIDNLQIPDNKDDDGNDLNGWRIRPVTYRDFAIIARTSSEMIPIENELKRRHIPYFRYKDRNLFNSFECRHWISLLNAIASDDFTGNGRRLLNEALFTVFFPGISIQDVSNTIFDSPTEPRRKLLLKWHFLASERSWTRLIESIFEDSQVEENLSDRLQSLSIIRQIGKYILDYLNENVCSLPDVSKHLERMAESSKEDEGALVENSTEADCVQLLTIHSSKGLEYPVVIPVAGFKEKNNQIPQAYTYHSDNKHFLGFSKADTNEELEHDTAHSLFWKEQLLEWQRLCYVAYTRAKDLMIIPIYKKWYIEEVNTSKKNEKLTQEKTATLADEDLRIVNEKNEFSFLAKSIESYVHAHSNTNEQIFEKNKNRKLLEKRFEPASGLIPGEHLKLIKNVVESAGRHSSYKHSYTSLTHKKDNDDMLVDGRTEEDDEFEESEEDSTDSSMGMKLDNSSEILFGGKAICVQYDKNRNSEILSDKYPKGPNLGEAVHKTFESMDFEKFDSYLDYKAAFLDEGFMDLIRNRFAEQSIKIDEEDSDKIIEQTAYYVWHTLNATFPEIKGSDGIPGSFSLKELKDSQHFSELEFNLNPMENSVFHNYCNGFIDLLFVREINNKKVYSIIDWKTDTKGSGNKYLDYSDNNSLRNRVESKYAIQRVLYSYCLIKWLKQWYTNNQESEIFDEHFGGIYYVFVRGCQGGTGNGIYAHTWDSWRSLEKAFKSIEKLNRG